MAEFVGAIGTVAAVAQMAEYAAKASLEFYDFLKTIKNAPREIVDITRDINTFHKLVCNLQGSLSSPTVQEIVSRDADISHALKALEEPMANCCDVFKSLTEKMRPHLKEENSPETPGTEKSSTDTDSSSKSNWKISRADMKWYFKRREVYSLVSQLERTKVTFADAMGSTTLYDPALFAFARSLLTLKSAAIKTELPEYSSTQTTIPSELENPFDQDAGAALRKFADTASTIGFPVTSKNDTEEEKRPELPRNNSILTKMLIQTVKDGAITDAIEALNVVHVDSQDQDGRTALSWAAELGRPNIAELLISRGASVSLRQYSTKRRAPNRPEPKQSNGRVPLHWAAACDRPVVVNLLLRNGANPNARSTVGRSALQEASMHNNISIVKTLVEHGADVNARSYNHGWTAMHEAAFYGHQEIAQYLSEHGAWLDPLTSANLKTPLQTAMTTKQLVVSRMLLDFGADPNAQMFHDTTALHIASAGGWIVGIHLLLKAGALINARDAMLHETPLHKAARNLQLNGIEALRRDGANEEARNIDGQTYRDIVNCARLDPDSWFIPVDDPSIY